jgi:hypothetical protein
METTETNNTLALVPQRELTPSIWKMIMEMAPVMYKSRLFGVTSQEAANAIMLKGFEMGLGLTASFEFIQVVQGKPALSPRGALALLHNSPLLTEINIKRLEDKGKFVGFECTMKRKTGFSYTARFTMDDAQRAEVVKPGSGWQHYPENMCLWRAVGFCADVVAPDVVGGLTAVLKMSESLDVTLTTGGDFVDVQPSSVPAAPVIPVITLDELLQKYDPDMILVANDGRMPMSDGEVAAVAVALGGTQ